MPEIRPITRDEIVPLRAAATAAFGGDQPREDDYEDRFLSLTSLDTTFAAFDHGRLVATFASYPFQVTVPGGAEMPMAGTTLVSVASTHRRRGLLTELMGRHLDQTASDLGLPFAALWASEERIYRRFGYGPATYRLGLSIPTELVDVPSGPADVSFRFVDADEAAKIFPGVYDRSTAGIAGTLSRSEAWWRERHFSDPEHRRGGASARRFVVAERDDAPVGYITYRLRGGDWNEKQQREGAVEIDELISVDDEVRRALWSFAAGIDLHPDLKHWGAPVDEPLLVEVDRFVSIRTFPADGLWIRPLDIPRMLEARSYESDGRVIFDVVDRFRGRGGTFELDVVDGSGQCRPSGDHPELSLDISDLGALYLGGGSAHRLARAGRINGDPVAINRFDTVLRTLAAPWCPEIF